MATGRIPDANTAPLTAKGDLYTYSTANARLAVGSNGDTLVADSAATTGLRWSSTPSASNPVINAAAQIWQRGTSMAGGTSASTGFCADRWQATRGGYAAGQTASRQATGDTTNLPFIQYCIRVQRDSGNTSTATSNLSQSFESSNSIPYAGKTVTLSFYARAGANYSATSNALTYRIDTGTGTDQNVINGYTGGASTLSATATLTTTWQRFQASATLPAATTEIGIVFLQTPTGTAGANDYYEITGVQIDIGSVALPFRTQNSTLQGELAACQRYYWRRSATDGAYTFFSSGFGVSTTDVAATTILPVRLRVAPTSVEYSNLGRWAGQGIQAITAVAFASGQNNSDAPICNFTATGAVASNPYGIIANNSTSAYLAFSAEL